MLKIINFAGSARFMTCAVNENILNRASILSIMAPRIYSTSQQPIQQGKLPKLPVPPLNMTMQRFLRSVKPFVTSEEYKRTEELANKFTETGGIGEKLQKLLIQRADKTDSWLADWWLNSAYLDFRWPVVVYSNPGLVFPERKFTSQLDQLNHAAKVISAAIDFKIRLDRNMLPIEKMGPHELDMSQYFKVLGTCRIPGIKRDSLRLPNPQDPANHIVVAHNNHFFAVPVFGNDGEPLNKNQILNQLTSVVSKSLQRTSPVGILTSEHRDIWGKVHKALTEVDKQNKVSLDWIERSLFLVCLDGAPGDLEKNAVNKMTSTAFKMTHGGGSKSNSGNRWFDKTIQFVIGPDGEVGLTYEHSPAEGQPIAVLMDHIEDYCTKVGDKSGPASSKFENPLHLPFNLTNDIKVSINEAEKHLDDLIADLEMNCFTYPGYGKNFIKTQKLSPDSYIQMAIQFAFYRLHNEPGAHYESASTRRFIHGRTETIRSCSIESVEFAKTMLNPSANDQDKAKALRNAIASHKDYTINALAGEGVDRHFLGLRLIAADNGIELPAFFKDEGYIRSAHMRLSTSQVAGRCHSFMCYGPLVNNGYGCCYNPRENEIVFGTSAHNSCPETSAVKFSQALSQSFDDMKSVLSRVPPPSKM